MQAPHPQHSCQEAELGSGDTLQRNTGQTCNASDHTGRRVEGSESQIKTEGNSSQCTASTHCYVTHSRHHTKYCKRRRQREQNDATAQKVEYIPLNPQCQRLIHTTHTSELTPLLTGGDEARWNHHQWVHGAVKSEARAAGTPSMPLYSSPPSLILRQIPQMLCCLSCCTEQTVCPPVLSPHTTQPPCKASGCVCVCVCVLCGVCVYIACVCVLCVYFYVYVCVHMCVFVCLFTWE